jgi:threonine/homoserine/homoserine lactone efflux protein
VALVAALFAASAEAFTVLKYLGAAYLAWLAWQSATAPGNAERGRPRRAQPSEQPAASAWRMVGGRGMMNLTNPKVLIFFLAFCPSLPTPLWQCGAADHAAGRRLHAGHAAGVWHHRLFSGTFGAAAALGARAAGNRAAGVVFLGLAVRLATVSRAATTMLLG